MCEIWYHDFEEYGNILLNHFIFFGKELKYLKNWKDVKYLIIE